MQSLKRYAKSIVEETSRKCMHVSIHTLKESSEPLQTARIPVAEGNLFQATKTSEERTFISKGEYEW